jgi:hypothetical protein
MPPTQERKIQTSAGMETATETVNRIKSQIGANNVPASVLSAPQQPDLNIPQTNVPQVSAGTAIAGAEQLTGTLQQQEAQRTQAEVQQAGAKLSDSERAIREAVGIIGTEGQARTQLEDSAGMTQMKNQLNQLSNQLFNQTNALRQFDVDNVNTIEQMRVDASKRDITKRTFGAQSAEAGIQMAVQRANMVGELYATQSSVQLLQGNIQQAAESIDKALQSIYEPKRQELQMEMMFFQRNGQLFDSAQNRAANARMEVIRQEQAQIDRAQDMIYNAVQNGYATADEVQEMVSLETPREQRELAQQIINRGAAQERGLRLEQLALSLATSRAQLAKLSEPDANNQLLQSLFSGGQPTQSFQEFLADRNLANMSLMPEFLAELEEEYNASFAVDPNQQQQVLSYLVATGQVSVQQAEFMQSNLNMTTASQKAKQQTTILRGQTVLRDVERALTEADKAGKVSGYMAESQRWFGTGPGLAARFSPAFELQQHLESIKSNVSIDQLQAMREASPTGGALGQVPVQQQVFLMQVLGSLSPSLNSGVLKENLNDVYNIYLDVMFGSPDELSSKVRSGQMTATQANSYLQQRKETGFNDYNLPVNKSNGKDIGDLVIAPDGSLVRVK